MSWFFFKQKTAYEMRISDGSSDVCSSDLAEDRAIGQHAVAADADEGRVGEHHAVVHVRVLADRMQALDPLQQLAVFVAARVAEPGVETEIARRLARKSVGWGKSVSVRGDMGGCRYMTTQNNECEKS